MGEFFSKLKYARDVLAVHEMVKTSAKVLGGDAAVGPSIIEKTISIYSNPQQFEAFLNNLMQSEHFASTAAQSFVVARHFIRFIYKFVLHREPEESALNAYAGAIVSGQLTYDSAALEIMSSPEAKARGGGGSKDFYVQFLNWLNTNLGNGKIASAQIDQLANDLIIGRSTISQVYQSLIESEKSFPVSTEELPKVIGLVYEALFERQASLEEVEIWKGHISAGTVSVYDFFKLINDSDEAKNYRHRKNEVSPELSDAEYVQMTYEANLERGASGGEIANWCNQLQAGQVTRIQMLNSLFKEFVLDNTVRPLPENDPYEVHLMGTSRKANAKDWKKDLEALKTGKTPAIPVENYSKFSFNVAKKKVLVSAIASLYKGGAYIEHFMENMTSQSIFKDYAELIIIDANSPENESVTIESFCKKFPNIKYKRYDYRVGIYEAWNIGVGAAAGQFLTNTNLDDIRRQDSLECQAAALLALPFVDVVYQDFYYAFDKNVDYDLIAQLGAKSGVPHVTPFSLFVSNPPHNAPMWRKSLHDELGLFDATFKSAGDYEFWMRCLAAGKKFYKLNDPHATYFQNPTGLSTSRETPGIVESKRISKKHGRKVIPRALTCSTDEFLKMADEKGDYPGLTLRPSDRYDFIQSQLEEIASELKYQKPARKGTQK